MANTPMALETLAHIAEINRAMVLMNLDGIPAAERNLRTTGSSQMNEVSGTAGEAVNARIARGDFRPLVQPQIMRQNGSAK